MTRFGKWKAKLGGLAVYTTVRGWMSTLDYQAVFCDRTVDPVYEGFKGPIIFVFWHEYLPCPVYVGPHCNVAMLVSRHRDAEWLSQAARLMGFRIVRGSTKRGGSRALRELLRTNRTMNLGITPDGPRGPRRRVAAGCVYLSAKLEVPLVPVGIGYHKPRRMPTWDRFAVPRPYSRARLVFGPRLQIPVGIGRDRIEHHQQEIETALNWLTQDAEQWADSGQRRRDQVPYSCLPAPPQGRANWISTMLGSESALPAMLSFTKKCA